MWHAAVSQRRLLESPDKLQSNEDDLRELLLEFFEQHIQDRFPEADYTFDVYVTTAGKVRPSEAQYLNLKPSLACDAHVEKFPAGWPHCTPVQTFWNDPLEGVPSG